jgi:hypothetical protein
MIYEIHQVAENSFFVRYRSDNEMAWYVKNIECRTKKEAEETIEADILWERENKRINKMRNGLTLSDGKDTLVKSVEIEI